MCGLPYGEWFRGSTKAVSCSTCVHASSWQNGATCSFDQRRGEALQPAAAKNTLIYVAALLGSHGPGPTQTTPVVAYSE
jgi:hypothetical protein